MRYAIQVKALFMRAAPLIRLDFQLPSWLSCAWSPLFRLPVAKLCKTDSDISVVAFFTCQLDDSIRYTSIRISINRKMPGRMRRIQPVVDRDVIT